jgi:molecular chaperone GrpE (heat shock protein)
MEKLQDGYDWNIIKSFCLRIIRCIDNVEKRIKVLSKKDVDTTGYEEIRDELIFALESNGLEQFVPEIKSDYHEQEKYIETVKGKEHTDSPELEGKIAKVLRRGYRCIIDEGNIKVVRTARVKLFG